MVFECLLRDGLYIRCADVKLFQRCHIVLDETPILGGHRTNNLYPSDGARVVTYLCNLFLQFPAIKIVDGG